MPNDQSLLLPVIGQLSIPYLYDDKITNNDPEDAYYDNDEYERRSRMVAIIAQYPESTFAQSYRQYLHQHQEEE